MPIFDNDRSPLAYTDAELSSLLRVSKRTVYRLRKSGALRAIRIGRSVRTRGRVDSISGTCRRAPEGIRGAAMRKPSRRKRAKRNTPREVPRHRWPGWMRYTIKDAFDFPSHAKEMLGPELTEALVGKVLGDFTLFLFPDGVVRVFWCCRIRGGWREQAGSLCPSCSLYEVFDTRELSASDFNSLSAAWWDAVIRGENESVEP